MYLVIYFKKSYISKDISNINRLKLVMPMPIEAGLKLYLARSVAF